jgi:diguanylate cyclase (GGDEF)-like protein
LLIDRLNQVISQAERHEQYFVVMYLDLDGFKHVNDTYGHKIGDQLLQVIADRLRSAMREIDTIARIGGDEFAAILSDIKELSIASLLFKRLLESVSMPVTIDTVEVSVSVSIGVVHYQQKEKTTTADQLLDKADKAMLKAKLLGKNRYCIYS